MSAPDKPALAACCEDWANGTRMINSAFAITKIHGCGDYAGPPFRCCPWCGASKSTPSAKPAPEEISERFRKAPRSRGLKQIAWIVARNKHFGLQGEIPMEDAIEIAAILKEIPGE